jgi:hypothetical protein
MTRETRLTDARIEALLRRRSAEPYEGMVRDILAASADLPQRRRWGIDVPTSRFAVLAAAAILAALMLGGALAVGALRDVWNPVPEPLRTSYEGPVPGDVGAMPAIVLAGTPDERWEWRDASVEGGEAAERGVDITGLTFARGDGRGWGLDLGRDEPPPITALLEYGLVFDVDGDGRAECAVGISNDVRQEELRAWVRTVTNGEAGAQVGPPIGHPMEFAFERGQGLRFLFLPGAAPCNIQRDKPAAYYAYASASVDGELRAWDYEPDQAWLVLADPPR